MVIVMAAIMGMNDPTSRLFFADLHLLAVTLARSGGSQKFDASARLTF